MLRESLTTTAHEVTTIGGLLSPVVTSLENNVVYEICPDELSAALLWFFLLLGWFRFGILEHVCEDSVSLLLQVSVVVESRSLP